MSNNIKCAKCNKFASASGDNTVKCKGKCKRVFHINCITKGICDICLAQKSDTPGSASPISRSNRFLDLDPESLTLKTLLEELNKKMEVVFKIEKDTSFYAKSYDEMLKKQEEYREELKKEQNKVQDLQNKYSHLEKTNQALEQRVQALEQGEKSRNVEIVGLKMKENEDIKVITEQITKQLDVKFSEVERAWRVGRGEAGKRAPPLVIRLRSEDARNRLLDKKNRLRSNSDIYPDDKSTDRVL
ncbi:hypothetical protein JYU34_005847 [Plutella xylostella]|uniref:FP protein N-terminal domain-containing protein n=1 Tax=Plutella xylostella TaxID=51655 RepID=A0ABQ7QU98_PLUXY|nr:hypothetical protein JYU34_005847 [Plutella xylostella]